MESITSGINRGKRILIIGDQIWAASARNYFRLEEKTNNIKTVSFFSMDKKIEEEGDLYISTENFLSDLIVSFKPEIVVGDPLCKSFIKDNSIRFMEVPHLAVSSRLHWDHDVIYTGGEINFTGKV